MMRNLFLAALAIAIVLIVALPCQGQEPPDTAPPEAQPTDVDVVPVLKGKPAPFTGLLVLEQRFTEMMEAELTASELAVKLKVADKATQALETMYRARLDEATKPTPWYSTPSFNMWLGFGIGVVVTALAVWGAVELTGAMNNHGGSAI